MGNTLSAVESAASRFTHDPTFEEAYPVTSSMDLNAVSHRSLLYAAVAKALVAASGDPELASKFAEATTAQRKAYLLAYLIDTPWSSAVSLLAPIVKEIGHHALRAAG